MPKSFDFIGGALCLDFINTVHCYGAVDPQDDIETPEDLLSWAVAAKLLSTRETAAIARGFRTRPARGRDILDQAKLVRGQLREMFRSPGPKARRQHVRALNSLLGRQTAVSGIASEAGSLHLQWRPKAPQAQGIVLPILLSAAEVITGGDFGRVRECASLTCTFLFLDTSKNHSRRWCDMRMCGNRAKVSQFRERQRRSPSR